MTKKQTKLASSSTTISQEERSVMGAKQKEKTPLLMRVRKFFSRETIAKLQTEGKDFVSLFAFFGLVLLFLVESMVRIIGKLPGARGKMQSSASSTGAKLFEKIASKLEASPGHIRRSVLISLAFRNMRVKKTRAFVTVGGMAMGIGAIVFLVSLGYGVQRLVVSRVARLEELRMADITTSSASNLRIDTQTLNTIKNMPSVKGVLPVISLVGKISFAGGQGEAVVHGVSKAYLETAGIKPTKGAYFESSESVANLESGSGMVAGASDSKPALVAGRDVGAAAEFGVVGSQVAVPARKWGVR